ncbi:MAG TPA: pyridoxal-phosphate dependent enzyme, partial [Victivallales bacterium]|nr:pyridoxal-phosphate dependent enzyme [Victivallales bacterium]
MELYELKIITKIPRIAVIQAEGANPLYRYWTEGGKFRPLKNPETIATAIKIGNPVSWEKSYNGIKWSNGTVEQVSEQEIMDAKAVVDSAGIGAEPASCCSVAGAKKLREKGLIKESDFVVGILTGNLLKDPDAVLGYHTNKLPGIVANFANMPIKIKANLESFKKILTT